MMNKISSCLKCRWLGGPSPGLCHATMTEVAPPVASVVRSTSMSRPNGLIDNACLGVTTAGCSGVRAFMDIVSSSSRRFSSTSLASPEAQLLLSRQLRRSDSTERCLVKVTSRRPPRRLRYSPLRPIYRTMQDLNDLYYFVAVVDHGGFAAAGRTLGLQKSKLSRRILQLEERLGVR